MSQLKQNFEAYRAQILASVAQNRVYPTVPYSTFEAWITSILTNVGTLIDAECAQNTPAIGAGQVMPIATTTTPRYESGTWPKVEAVTTPLPQNTSVFEVNAADNYFLK